MSTIRRHGVTFHLLPTLDDSLWVEVIRESDGAVLVTSQFDGDDNDFEGAVVEWFGMIVQGSITGISIPLCRSCKGRRREVGRDHDGNVLVEFLVEHSFDLCLQCANHLEQTNPWIRRYVQERFCYDEENNW